MAQSIQSMLEELTVHGWDIASLTPAAMLALEAQLPAALGWRAGTVIATCQRYEFISLDGGPAADAPRFHRGEDALVHISGLAAGLESLVLGETQIFGQVRSSLSKADPEMRRLLAPALAAARSLRGEQAFSQHAGHALDYALQLEGVLPRGRLLVLGGGAMGRRVAERGLQLGFEVAVAARRAVTGIAAAYVPLAEVSSQPPFDIVAGCLGADAPRMGRQHLPSISTLAIDFGTPRCLVDDIASPLVTIADLLAHRESDTAFAEQREALRSRLRMLLEHRLLMSAASGDSPLGELRGELETIRLRELARATRLHPELPVEAIDTITRSLVNQLFHRPSLRLRRSANHDLAKELVALFTARADGQSLAKNERGA